MNVVAVIQARMGSTRLPGKVLAEIGGRSMLAQVCRRVARAATVDRLVVATTVRPEDEAVVDECERLGVACFRGSEHDVLDRYCRAARAYEADAIVRITADCPLIDPDVIDLVVRAFLEERPDYAANTLRRTWPRGLDTEVTNSAALARADREATEPYQRVHVTPYLYQHPDRFRLLAVSGARFHRARHVENVPHVDVPHSEDFSRHRWTVDLPADLDFVRGIYRRFDGDTFSWEEVLQLLAREPALADVNGHVRQKHLVEG